MNRKERRAARSRGTLELDDPQKERAFVEPACRDLREALPGIEATLVAAGADEPKGPLTVALLVHAYAWVLLCKPIVSAATSLREMLGATHDRARKVVPRVTSEWTEFEEIAMSELQAFIEKSIAKYPARCFAAAFAAAFHERSRLAGLEPIALCEQVLSRMTL